MAVLDEILAANAKVAGTLPPPEGGFEASRNLCVVTCIDPRLTRFFPQALGLERGEATIVRLPGPALAGGSDLVRAVATAIFANDCDEVLVLAHTDCALTRCDSGTLASAMNRRGVAGALPTDPRSFFGLAASPRQIASDTASALRGSPLIPKTVLVHAAIIDIHTGAVEVVSRGENAQAEPQAGAGGSGGLPTLDGPSAFGSPSGLPSLSGPSPLSSLSALGTSGPSSLPSLDGPGLSIGSALPTGLGIGEGSARSASAAPLAAFGPMAATPSSMPAAPTNTTSFQMPAFDQSLRSTIDLTPSVVFGPATVLEPVQTVEQTMQAPPVGAAQLEPDEPVTPVSSPLPRPRPSPQRPPPRPLPRKAAPPAGRLSLSPQMAANMEKVGAFYRAEMKPEAREQALADLDNLYRGAAPNSELIRVVFKPILESGPKRYKVIDELLAIKESATAMERNDCYTALRQLLG